MEFLHALVVDPYDHPQGWFAYLILPALGSAVLGWMKPSSGRVTLVVLWPFISTLAYFTLHVWLYDVSSTIGIGVMYALVVYSIVCWITFAIVRRVRRDIRPVPR